MLVGTIGHEPIRITIDIDGTNPWAELSLALVAATGRLRSNKDLVFRGQRSSESGEAILRSPAVADVDLSKLPRDVDSVMLVLSALPGGRAPSTLAIGLRTRGARSVGRIAVPVGFAGAMTIGSIRRWADGWRLDVHAGAVHSDLPVLANAYGAAFVRAKEKRSTSLTVSDVIEQRRLRTAQVLQRDAVLGESASKALEALVRKGHGDLHARVTLVLDISISMDHHYESGDMELLVRRVLGMGFQVDDDGRVDVFLCGTEAYDYGSVDERSYKSFVQEMRRDHPLEKKTMYGKAMETVLDHYEKEPSKDPLLVLFVTDGDTMDKEKTEELMRASSNRPIFWQFLAIGTRPTSTGDGSWLPQGFEFLERLDRLPGRRVDNAAFAAIENPGRIDEEPLYAMMLKDYFRWLDDARRAGVLDEA